MADINSIPDELLAAIIQHLPHRECIRVEQINKRWQRVASSQGWADVKCFHTREYRWVVVPLRSTMVSSAHYVCSWQEEVAEVKQLLIRCGKHVDSLHLHDINTDGQGVVGLLRQCPNASRVHFHDVALDARALNYLRKERLGGMKGLRSLSFPNDLHSLLAAVGDAETSLESLSVGGYKLTQGMKLPTHLCELFVEEGSRVELPLSEVLSSETQAGVLHGLRSLRLHQIGPIKYDFLSAYGRLTRLGVQVKYEEDVTGLASALAYLPALRALELDSGYGLIGIGWDAVVDAIAANRPELEHLSLNPWTRPSKAAPSVESLLRLERLISLEMRSWPDWKENRKRWPWGWLEALAERGKLEHLIVEDAPVPMKHMCLVVKRCRVRLQ